MRSWSCVAVLAVLLLVASSCGGSGEAVATTASAQDGDGSASSQDRETLEDIVYESPLADFLGQDVGRFQFDEAQAIQQQREAESRIAECMAEEGFEYTPRDPSEMMSFGGPFSTELEPGSDAWIEKYGFGISTTRFPQSAVGDLVGMDDAFMFGPPPDMEDPNQAYVESLSEGEREAYYAALSGPPPDFGPDFNPEEGPGEDFVFEPSGCQFEGFRDGPGGPGSENVRDFYQAFGDEVRTMQERIEADSRVVAYTAKVSACVAERGMDWTGFQDVFRQFEPRLGQIQQGGFGSGEAFAIDEDMSEREVQERFIESQKLSPESLAILAEIQADEIALARAVIECDGGPVNEQRVRNEVRVEYEQAFLDENAEAVAEFKAE